MQVVDQGVYRKLNAIDISKNDIDAPALIEALSKDPNVVRVIHSVKGVENQKQRIKYDSKEPCIHVEIKQ